MSCPNFCAYTVRFFMNHNAAAKLVRKLRVTGRQIGVIDQACSVKMAGY